MSSPKDANIEAARLQSRQWGHKGRTSQSHTMNYTNPEDPPSHRTTSPSSFPPPLQPQTPLPPPKPPPQPEPPPKIITNNDNDTSRAPRHMDHLVPSQVLFSRKSEKHTNANTPPYAPTPARPTTNTRPPPEPPPTTAARSRVIPTQPYPVPPPVLHAPPPPPPQPPQRCKLH